MKFLCSVHLYPPKHNCGGEYMLHALNKFLISKGHEVRVLLWQARNHKINEVYVFDGVDIFPPDQYLIETLMRWTDVIITHLDYTQQTIQYGKIFRKPVIHLIHNYHEYGSIKMADRP